MAKDIKFSILILTVDNRKHFLERLMVVLNKQKTDEVEILINCDNGTKSKGFKRNELLDQAIGEYVAFVDDDDLVSDDYVGAIISAIDKSKPDVIGMHLLMTQNGTYEERTYHSLKYRTWYHEPDPDRPGKTRYFRNPNHLNPVKREYAVKTRFPSPGKDGKALEAEDKVYSADLLKHLKTEEYIEQPIYHYLYRSK